MGLIVTVDCNLLNKVRIHESIVIKRKRKGGGVRERGGGKKGRREKGAFLT